VLGLRACALVASATFVDTKAKAKGYTKAKAKGYTMAKAEGLY